MVMNFLYAVGLIKKMMMKTKREEISGNQSLSSHLRRLMLDSEVTFIFQCLLFYFLHLPFPSLSLYLIHSLIKASQSTFIIIVIVTRKKATKSLRKEKLFFITLRYSVHCVCLCCIIFYILHIYIHDDFFKRNVIGRDNKRHHNYNQKKICVFFCLFLFI